jgi:hypothetical protein
VAVATAIVAVWLVVARVGGTDDDGASPSGSPEPSGEAPPSSLAMLQITGGPDALVAMVGSGGGRTPAVIALDPSMTFVAPGQGEVTVQDAASLPGSSLRVAVSNAFGAWASHFAVLELDGLASAVDRAGGITVDLPEGYATDAGTFGPGETALSGDQVAALLAAPTEVPMRRFVAVLEGMFETGLTLEQGDVVDSDDVAGASAIIQAAQGATVDLGPIRALGGVVFIADDPAFDQLVQERFGTRAPSRLLVENGNGEPGVGEAVAELLIPQGFRVVLSKNADSFEVVRTQIVAVGDDNLPLAEAAREALGVGRIEVTQVPSGLADVRIVVGKDFG